MPLTIIFSERRRDSSRRSPELDISSFSGYSVGMKTRLPIFVVLATLVLAASALAQASRWDTISYEKWGFTIQLPSGSVKHAIDSAPANGVCDVFESKGLVCVVKVSPASDDLPTSTAIEQSIQAEVKLSSKLGSVKRWEQESKQGELFKGFSGGAQLSAEDPVQAAIGKILGDASVVECAAMAPVGDDNSPILCVSVFGPSTRQMEVITTAKGIAAFVSRGAGAAKAKAPQPKQRVAAAKPAPKPVIKSWPALKKGQIELAGVVESVDPKGKSLIVMVDLVTVIGTDPIALSPARSKTVLLRNKLVGVSVGQRVRLIGKNTGVGKPITADAVEPAQEKQLETPAQPMHPAAA